MKNYYDILGVDEKASESDIKKAFRKLSLKHHPDRGGDSEKFKEINEAYETLKDGENKEEYDFKRNNPMFSQRGMPPGFMQADDILNNIMKSMMAGGPPPNINQNSPFGNPFFKMFVNGRPVHQGHNHFQKPAPIVKSIEITLEQSYLGVKLPIELERWIVQNNVKTAEKEKIYIDIPDGIDDNEMIILENRGNIINNGVKGDVKIIVKVKNETIFERRGIDLILKKKLSLKESLCGFTLNINHINGKVYKINHDGVNNIIKPDASTKLDNLGMKRNGSSGGLIILFQIEFPEKLSQEQINKLKDIL
tara:strand:+ start:11102 stop:12022 length:921 start_codon:yes stop_codon:yes gene_type:complete